MSEEKKTGFLVEGEWENSYLDIMWGSAVQLLGSSLEIAGAKGDLTVSGEACFSFTLTVGVFLTSNSLTKCATKQLRTSVTETTASEVRLAISNVEGMANQSHFLGTRVKGVIDTLQLRVDEAIASADKSQAELSRLAAAARQNEVFLTALGVRGDGTELTGVINEALVTGQRAVGNNSRLTAKDMKMGAVDLGAAGDLAVSKAKINQCAGLTTELTALTTHV